LSQKTPVFTPNVLSKMFRESKHRDVSLIGCEIFLESHLSDFWVRAPLHSKCALRFLWGFHYQGCQMVSFQTKNPNLGKFWRAWNWKMLLYIMAIWNILRPFGIFYDHLVHFVFIWYIFSSLGIMHREKSGNPVYYPLWRKNRLRGHWIRGRCCKHCRVSVWGTFSALKSSFWKVRCNYINF
jgi:hypothetical protein